MKNNKLYLFAKFFAASLIAAVLLNACSVSKQINKNVSKNLLSDSVIASGHIGISIYEPSTGKYWYNYNADKYFIPASNTKLFTLYAGMKYLGDSLVGMKYAENDSAIFLTPTGDPTFLHPDFQQQPVLSFLQKQKKKFYISINNWKENALGKGWAWDDYNEPYMAERSALPVAGNVSIFENHKTSVGRKLTIPVLPKYFVSKEIGIGFVMLNEMPNANNVYALTDTNAFFSIKRNYNSNKFELYGADKLFINQKIPFKTDSIKTALEILRTDYSIEIFQKESTSNFQLPTSNIIKTQPSDSLFKPMMYNSDNFFAEQTLLMVSNEKLDFMSDEAIIDTLLKTDLKDIPQKPHWVDGSGLSRYNLFTPHSFIYILSKMKNEFGYNRLKTILPTGGEGTLKNYFMADSSFIYAKTGSMSNNVSISGFLETKKGKLLIFSMLNNNFMGSATLVRRKVEAFLACIREKY
jgi:D-alanyl-D-alanine carboxypeptidase/D-alanyl-D-alanine-endopeptidase (penicillin-binding protein 4)